MAWTKAQQKVIDTRDKNLLVSAAAGSGKTAVLVERIIAMISEGEKPLDIDRLLVVTFTNAAAAEMRTRIGEAIDKKLIEHPENLHLQKQLSLLQSAQITTIHSFCLNVIRNYFHSIDLDPAFKIAEESEITLLQSDVIAELLERWYEEGREEFHDFVESYSYSKSDLPIEELILKLYSFSMSSPWPEIWIDEKITMFELNSVEEMSQAHWMKELLEYIRSILGDLLHKNEIALSLCNEPGGPGAYLPALLSDRGILTQLSSAGSYEDYVKGFADISYERLSAKKEEGVQPFKKEKVKELRDEIKKGMKDMESQFFFQSSEEMLVDIQAVNPAMKVLFELTLEFMRDFAKKKEEKNLIDFNDLEHFALKILVRRQLQEEVVRVVPTEAAIELGMHFEEILIDEYQDSNMVQETILRSISREDVGQPNRFMVGDVKQSIYKFRLAMPEIFMEKYENYSCSDSLEDGRTNLYQRIDLDRNFRSRACVLKYVNEIFEQIMHKSVGGIEYDEAAALKYGELFEETLKNSDQAADIQEEVRNRINTEIELLMVTEEAPTADNTPVTDDTPAVDHASASDDTPTVENYGNARDEDPEEAVYTKKELEARAIARRIKELTDPEHGMLVFDAKKKAHRPAAYKDIVILLRSMSGWSEVFVKTLMQEGIPAFADTGTGYFQTLEIMTILNMLRIIDNPRQDIPFTGVLYSPIVGVTSTELSYIRAFSRNTGMYTAACSYVKDGSDEPLKEKLRSFIELLEGLRSMVNHKPIHEIIQMVFDQTGYYYYASAMPGGDRRKANLDMLVSKAVRFEKGSYSGLFHFIRYIEKLHKYEVDFGEASATGEQEDTIRIMSIHKSKGLEFPIVFVAAMSKQFNTQDLRSSIVLHNEMGVGPEYIDSRKRTKVPTLMKRVIQKKIQTENMGEELRVLYVAMTRAREKLILSGYLKSEKEIKAVDFTFYEILSAKSYLDFVLPAMVNKIGWAPGCRDKELIYRKDGMAVTVIPKEKMLTQEMVRQMFLRKDEEDFLSLDENSLYDQTARGEIRTRFNYIYPYIREAGLKVKMTVSELKKLGQYEAEEQSLHLLSDETFKADEQLIGAELPTMVPNFISEKEEPLSGTDRGTLYHKVLELIDLGQVRSSKDLKPELDRIVHEGYIKETDVEKLKQDYIIKFIDSNVAERMRCAEYEGKLYKEKQFVMGVKAMEVLPDSNSDELILIQGIIDVFFEEEGELVLLDYKSDLVMDKEQLISRYQVQLDYYRKALEQIQKKRVKELIIYSLPLGEEIRIDG